MPDTAPIERQEDLKSLRLKNRIRRELLEAQRIEQLETQSKTRRLKEWWYTDWVNPYLDLISASQGHTSQFGVANRWQRRRGGNYPIYRSEEELALLRFPSRWIAATNTYGIGLMNGIMGYCLGSGLTYRAVPKEKDDHKSAEPLCKAVQTIIDDFLEMNDWYGGEKPGFEEECFNRSIEDGEFIAISFVNRGQTQQRNMEPEQLTIPPGSSDEEWSFGIKTDPKDAENPLAYNIAWDEGKSECQEFTPDEVTHYRRNCKRSSKRGVPEFTFDTYDALDLASKLRGNMGEGAAQQASIAQVMTFKNGSQSDIQAVATGANSYQDFDPYTGQQIGVRKTKRGTTEYLPDSQQYIAGPAASNASAHNEILQMLVRSVCARWNAPEWLGTSDASNNNRASGMNAERSFINTVKRNQRRFCAVLRKIVWKAVREYIEYGLISGVSWEMVENTIDLKVEAPNPEPESEIESAQVAAIEIPLGVQSRQAYAQQKGRDWDQIESDNRTYESMNSGEPTDKQVKDANDTTQNTDDEGNET